MSDDSDRTASLMSPAKLAQLRAKPAASPKAWLDQMASDAGSGHARRMVDLRQQLEDQVRERNYASIGSKLQALSASLGEIDFSLLQPRGWLARATGKGKSAGGEFLSQYEEVRRAAEDLKQEARSLQKKQLDQAGATERTLVEFAVELRAIEKIMEQGARWLQDMRNQLKTRQAGSPDAQAQQKIAEDSERCELLVNRLKQLRAATTAGQQMQQQVKSAADQRVAVLKSLQHAVDADLKTWQERMSRLAAKAEDGAVDGPVLDGAKETNKELQLCLKQAANDFTQLQAQEGALAGDLALLAQPLRAAS